MAGALLIPAGQIVSPEHPQLDLAVGPNFERFDGLDVPDTNPATAWPEAGGTGTGADYGFDVLGHYPRPGQTDQPMGQVYTPGPLRGVVGTVGGQPLSAARVSDRIHRPAGDYSPGKTHSIQYRLGVTQASDVSNIGAGQTNALGEITSNPPQPGDLASIIAGLA